MPGQSYGAIQPSPQWEWTVKIKNKDVNSGKEKSSNKCCPIVVLVVGVLLAIIGVIMFPLMDIVIRDQIEKKVIISNESDIYDIWQDNPVPIYMQFYIFNVENKEEILEGGKPVVTQHGPYTYRERRFKFDIVWNPNGTVTYKQNKTYHFVPEMSEGNETDRFTTLNPLMATVVQAIKWLPEVIRGIVSAVINTSGADGVFMNRTVYEILWGYDDPTLKTLNGIIPLWFFSTKIGYFIRRNYTDDGVYTVFTGEGDTTKLGHIDKYNGKIYLDLWTTPWADMVNGTDGSIDAPFRFNKLVQHAFVSQICRSVKGYYRGMVDSPHGIPLRRFTGNEFTFGNVSDNPENLGFCTPQTNCLPAGLLNSTLCQDPVDYFMIPAIISFPHYLYADPEVLNSVEGMSPNKKEHETVIDIEPWTGLVLRVASRIQINFYIEKVAAVGQTKNIRSLYFPILWLNESAVTDKEHEDMLLNELFLPMTILSVVKIVFIAIGALMCVGVVVVVAKRAREKAVTLKNNEKIANKVEQFGGGASPSYSSLVHTSANSSMRSDSVDASGNSMQRSNGRGHHYEDVPPVSPQESPSAEKNYLIKPPSPRRQSN